MLVSPKVTKQFQSRPKFFWRYCHLYKSITDIFFEVDLLKYLPLLIKPRPDKKTLVHCRQQCTTLSPPSLSQLHNCSSICPHKATPYPSSPLPQLPPSLFYSHIWQRWLRCLTRGVGRSEIHAWGGWIQQVRCKSSSEAVEDLVR